LAYTIGYDLLSFLLSISLLGLYHLYLRIKVAHNPAYTVQSVNIIVRTAWVENIMQAEGKEVLAVQILRNSTVAATFPASSAMLLIMGVLNLSEQGDRLVGPHCMLGATAVLIPVLYRLDRAPKVLEQDCS